MATIITSRIISNQPDRIRVRNSRRLTAVTVRKTKIPNIARISMSGARKGFIAFNAPTGEVATTSSADQAQKTRLTIKRSAVNITVITVDRIISSRSGISSLNLFHTGLGVVRITART